MKDATCPFIEHHSFQPNNYSREDPQNLLLSFRIRNPNKSGGLGPQARGDWKQQMQRGDGLLEAGTLKAVRAESGAEWVTPRATN